MGLVKFFNIFKNFFIKDKIDFPVANKNNDLMMYVKKQEYKIQDIFRRETPNFMPKHSST